MLGDGLAQVVEAGGVARDHRHRFFGFKGRRGQVENDGALASGHELANHFLTDEPRTSDNESWHTSP